MQNLLQEQRTRSCRVEKMRAEDWWRFLDKSTWGGEMGTSAQQKLLQKNMNEVVEKQVQTAFSRKLCHQAEGLLCFLHPVTGEGWRRCCAVVLSIIMCPLSSLLILINWKEFSCIKLCISQLFHELKVNFETQISLKPNKHFLIYSTKPYNFSHSWK